MTETGNAAGNETGKAPVNETGKPTSNRNLHVTLLGIVGIILLIVGIAIATVHGTHLRGSGLGTVAIVLGVVLLLVAALRYTGKIGK